MSISYLEIPVTIYTPINHNSEKLGIYFHGGAWMMCSRKTHQTIVNYLANITETVWISVEYRLALEHKFSVGFDDAVDVARYIVENKQSFGVNENAKVGVAEDSVGATISTFVARSIKNIQFQMLVYGVFDFSLNTPSGQEFTDPMYYSPPEFVEWVKVTGLRNKKDTKDPRVAVLRNQSFENLPSCLLIAAELDRFRDDNYRYQKLLEKDGVEVQLVLIEGVFHGYFGLPGVFKQGCGQTLLAMRDFMATI